MLFAQPPVMVVSPIQPRLLAVRSEEASTLLVAYGPGAVRCAGTTVPFVRRIQPFVTSATQYPGRPALKPASLRLRFRIASDGRPMSIARLVPSPDAPGLFPDTSDLEPSLAASRFAPGERADCEVTYQPVSAPLNQAGQDFLLAAVDSPLLRPQLRSLYARLAPANSNCEWSQLKPRVLVTPDLRRFENRPERRGAFVSFDLTADGHPRNVRLLQPADPEAAREVRAAISANRFFPGTARRGCVMGFSIGGRQTAEEKLRPPPAQPTEDSRQCPPSPAAIRPFQPGTFPENFSRRNVEGYAFLRYDVATWGEVGNIRVDVSEPAAGFGERAAAALRGQSFPPGEGRTDCRLRVVYRLGD